MTMYRTVDAETAQQLFEKILTETDPIILPAGPAPADSDADAPAVPVPIFRDDDHRARFEAVQRTRADLRFDGLAWDDIMESVNQRFIDAGLDLDQYIDTVKALVAGDPRADRSTVEARLTGMRQVELHLRPV